MKHLLAASLWLISSLALADGYAGGNCTDLPLPGEGSAWFLPVSELVVKPANPTPRTVHYCFVVGPNFGVEASELRSTIEAVFANWKDYIHTKNLRGPVTDVSYIGNCDGREDLRFYFGVKNAEVAAAAAKYEPTALAFAKRTNYDSKLGWGKGFVWLAATSPILVVDWTAPGRLFGVISHEVGHVLGTDHVPGTIMRASMAVMLPDSTDPKLFYRIDQESEVATSQSPNALTYRGQDASTSPVSVTWLEPFSRFATERHLRLEWQGRTYYATLHFALHEPQAKSSTFHLFASSAIGANQLMESNAWAFTVSGKAIDGLGHELHLMVQYGYGDGDAGDSLFGVYYLNENFEDVLLAKFRADDFSPTIATH